jgi:hypothetical protein
MKIDWIKIPVGQEGLKEGILQNTPFIVTDSSLTR